MTKNLKNGRLREFIGIPGLVVLSYLFLFIFLLLIYIFLSLTRSRDVYDMPWESVELSKELRIRSAPDFGRTQNFFELEQNFFSQFHMSDSNEFVRESESASKFQETKSGIGNKSGIGKSGN